MSWSNGRLPPRPERRFASPAPANGRSSPPAIVNHEQQASKSLGGNGSAVLSALLRTQGHLMAAGPSSGDREREAELLSAFVRFRVDGLLVAPASQAPAQLDQLAAGRAEAGAAGITDLGQSAPYLVQQLQSKLLSRSAGLRVSAWMYRPSRMHQHEVSNRR